MYHAASQSTNTDQFNRISSWLHAPTCSTPLTHWLNAPTHSTRWLHASTHSLDKKATVEKAVETVKENKRKVLSSEPSGPPQIKPSLVKRVKDVALHYYHGFRLLALDLRVAVRLLMKTMRGHSLTRREQKQVSYTTSLYINLPHLLVYSFGEQWVIYFVLYRSLCLSSSPSWSSCCQCMCGCSPMLCPLPSKAPPLRYPHAVQQWWLVLTTSRHNNHLLG